MKHFDGWRRLTIVLSGLWLLAVLGLVARDYHVVSVTGETTGFVGLQDSNTGQTFGGLSRSQIRRVAELAEKSAQSASAAEKAAYYLDVQTKPWLRFRNIALIATAPIALLWLLYASSIWVIAGFRQRAGKSIGPDPESRGPAG